MCMCLEGHLDMARVGGGCARGLTRGNRPSRPRLRLSAARAARSREHQILEQSH